MQSNQIISDIIIEYYDILLTTEHYGKTHSGNIILNNTIIDRHTAYRAIDNRNKHAKHNFVGDVINYLRDKGCRFLKRTLN